MATSSAYAKPGPLARWRAQDAAAEARTSAAYAAEGVGTFLLVFFICAVISVGNAGTLQLDIAGLGLLHALILNPARWLGPALASGTYGDFWIYLVGPVAGAIAAAFGYRWLVLDR